MKQGIYFASHCHKEFTSLVGYLNFSSKVFKFRLVHQINFYRTKYSLHLSFFMYVLYEDKFTADFKRCSKSIQHTTM